ncbi:MAG TPA: PAC2 family protein [Tepidisphaeraceae bacterium]
MAIQYLHLNDPPKLKDATLLLALTGWMDGGSVSTGTVKQLMGMGTRKTRQIGSIEADDFYIYNFPGDMETSALFRPHVVYDDGVVTKFEMPTNVFRCDEQANLVYFIGKEPNVRWQAFADCIFELTKTLGVSRIIFMGSFGGSVPHTREPRLYGSVSDKKLRPLLDQYRLRPSEYEGPGSFATLLLHEAKRHGVEMISLVAEIPGYLQGINPLSIEAISRRLSSILNIPVDLDALRSASNEWETRVSEAVEKDDELRETIRKLEEAYDNDLLQEVD